MKRWLIWTVLFGCALGISFAYFIKKHRDQIVQSALSQACAPYTITSETVLFSGNSCTLKNATLYGKGIVASIPQITVQIPLKNLFSYLVFPWEKSLHLSKCEIVLPKEPIQLQTNPTLSFHLFIDQLSQTYMDQTKNFQNEKTSVPQLFSFETI